MDPVPSCIPLFSPHSHNSHYGRVFGRLLHLNHMIQNLGQRPRCWLSSFIKDSLASTTESWVSPLLVVFFCHGRVRYNWTSASVNSTNFRSKILGRNCVCFERVQTFFLAIFPKQHGTITTYITFILPWCCEYSRDDWMYMKDLCISYANSMPFYVGGLTSHRLGYWVRGLGSNQQILRDCCMGVEG